MKFILFIACILILGESQAQFGKDILKRTKESAKRKASNKVDQKIDQTIDKGIEKTDSIITGKKGDKKNNTAIPDENAGSSEPPAEEAAPGPQKPAEKTVTTPAGASFTGNKLTVTGLVFNETSFDFDPNPNDKLNAAGASLKQELKEKKVLVKIYQRSSGDTPEKAEEEYMSLKMYLVNRYDLNEDRIYFICPAAKKAGNDRLVEFILVPTSFSQADAGKY
jgi:hypothetical protein